MGFFFVALRFITAVLMPISAVVLSYLTIRITQPGQGDLTAAGQTCRRCSQSRAGAVGEFHYTENIGSPRQQMVRGQSIITEESILGTEAHFICDQCARRFVNLEILQQVLVVIPYPLYLFMIVPLILGDGASPNFLIEIFLLVFSLAGTASAWNLYRATRKGETPLAEARDRVAIQERKQTLGKGFSYFTRSAMQYYQTNLTQKDEQ